MTSPGVPSSADDAVLAAIQSHATLRAERSADSERVGPFVLRFDAEWESPFVNFAVPDAGATLESADLERLLEVFRLRDRMPRFEFLPSAAPELEAGLVRAGFVVENRAAVMICRPDDLLVVPPMPGVVINVAAGDIDFAEAADVQHTAYGESGSVTASEIDWLVSTAASGGVVLLAREAQHAVGAGVSSPARDGLSELAGLAVSDSVRGRGIGGLLAANLTRAAFDGGATTVWLEPADPGIERMYLRVGYRTIGEKLNVSRSAPSVG